MDDLISRKDAIDALGEEPIVLDEWKDEYNKGMRTLWAVAKRDIESLPSIDAVQVIRCKDCKQCRKTILFGHFATVCDYWIKLTDDDGYCNRAERKEE